MNMVRVPGGIFPEVGYYYYSTVVVLSPPCIISHVGILLTPLLLDSKLGQFNFVVRKSVHGLGLGICA